MAVLVMAVKSKAFILDLPFGPVDHALAHFVSAHPEVVGAFSKIGIAYSGGADSTALLWAAKRLWHGQVCALHVHHGLQEAADDFLNHCKVQCESLGITLVQRLVNARHVRGESPEDAARNSRYCALVEMAKEQEVELVLLGQHADDQMETFILALSRGAGLPGLACMPEFFERNDIKFARPMLSVGAAELRAWLCEQGIDWVEDPTNQDRCFTRNRIRLDVLPALLQAFPAYQQTFARSISHITQAQSLLEELAEQDIGLVGTPPVIKGLQQLTQARQANSLRYWLAKFHNTAPSTAQLHELLRQIECCRTRGHRIELKVGHGKVVRQLQNLERLEFICSV